ncbi:MAG: hypothetical protein BMS9Abin26_0258 [Gammaproteobacteria bacterium]|nr:MAG: hypothetical protein BMS9Abin26_0258 [Gammaproteobacteria bacterium]
MVHFAASVDIMVEPFFVFMLVENVGFRSRLNPYARVLDLIKETRGPISIGTTFCHRQIIEGHLSEHRSICTEYVPGNILETESDTDPRFKVRLTVDPILGGARLTQEESFELSPFVMPIPTADGLTGKFFRLIFGDNKVIRQPPESLIQEELELVTHLQPKLAMWLRIIKLQLEHSPAMLLA